MKKITLAFTAALLMTAVISCKKDNSTINNNNNNNNNNTTTNNHGVYVPTEKINKVYDWDKYEFEKILSEVWNWDAGKLVSIDHMRGEGYYSWTESFTYAGNRLSRIDRTSRGGHLEFSYSGGNLIKASYYYDNKLEEDYQFKYGASNLVNEIIVTYYDNNDSIKAMGRRGGRGYRDNEVTTLKVTWSGENIGRAVINGQFSEGIYSETYNNEYTFKYDTKTNPKQGFLGLYSFMDDFDGLLSFFCKNNVLQATCKYDEIEYENGVMVDHDSGVETYEFVYEYDAKGCPLCTTRTHIYEDGDTSSYTFYYEYQ